MLKGSGLIGLSPNDHQADEIKMSNQAGVKGFIAQLKDNKDFTDKFDQIFSIYLSNDGESPGKITFGGYDLSFAQKGHQRDKSIFWVK